MTNRSESWPHRNVQEGVMQTPDIHPSFFHGPFAARADSHGHKKRVNINNSVIIEELSNDTNSRDADDNGWMDLSSYAHQQRQQNQRTAEVSPLRNQMFTSSTANYTAIPVMSDSPNSASSRFSTMAEIYPVASLPPSGSHLSANFYQETLSPTGILSAADTLHERFQQASRPPVIHRQTSINNQPHTLAEFHPQPSMSFQLSPTSPGIYNSHLAPPDVRFCESPNGSSLSGSPISFSSSLGSYSSSSMANTAEEFRYLTLNHSALKGSGTISKKSRMTSKQKEREMEDRLRYFIEDNHKCERMISDIERQILACKSLIKNVFNTREMSNRQF